MVLLWSPITQSQMTRALDYYRLSCDFFVAHTNITPSTVRHHNKSTGPHRCLFPFLAPSGAQGVTMFVRPSGLSMSSSTDIFLSHVIIIQAPRLSASSSHFPAEHFWLRRELKESQCSSDHLFTVYWVYSSNNKCFLSRKIIWMVFTCLTKFYLSNDKILNILSTAPSLSSSRITCLSSHYVQWTLFTDCDHHWVLSVRDCPLSLPRVSKYLHHRIPFQQFPVPPDLILSSIMSHIQLKYLKIARLCSSVCILLLGDGALTLGSFKRSNVG